MVKLAEFNKGTLVEQQINQLREVAEQREYLGMSSIGHECSRYLWYAFRWAYTEVISARMLRLFNRGHREEDAVISILTKIGIEIDGQQTGFSACWGHVGGHCDGIARNVPDAPKSDHILEIKTMNDASFKDTQKKKVQIAKPTYYAQMQLYMHFSKLKRSLFIAVNKNDDSWYVERVKYDKSFTEDLIRKAESIILSEKAPDKLLPVGWYACKWCAAYNVCCGVDKYDKNCRTCSKIELEDKGIWSCSLKNKKLWLADQKLGCDQYECVSE